MRYTGPRGTFICEVATVAGTGGTKRSAGDDFSLYIAVAIPAIVLIIWLVTFWFLLQSPIVDTTEIDTYFEELNTPPELPIEEPLDEAAP
jgi:hypothetical protein